MSDNETTQPTAAPVKKKMTELLEMVTLIAQGADKDRNLPGAEGYDEKTAPNETVRWCASVLRVFIMRVIDNVLDLRHAIVDLQKKIADLPAMRAEMKEMGALIKLIVSEIQKAKAAAGQPMGEQPVEGSNGEAPTDGSNGSNGEAPPKTPEQIEAEQKAAELDALAARMAQGEKPDLSNIVQMRQPPAAPPVPQTQPQGPKPVA